MWRDARDAVRDRAARGRAVRGDARRPVVRRGATRGALWAAVGAVTACAPTVPRHALPSTNAASCPRGALPAYAHNDYRNAHPLADALRLGFRGVEADLVLVDGVLRVGHDRREARRGPTFEAAYVAPLAALVTRCGALVPGDVPFLLTVDLKEPDRAAYDTVLAVLARHVPHACGAAPIEVVFVNWHPASPPTLRGWRVSHHAAITTVAGPVPRAAADTVRLLSIDYARTIGRPWRTRAARQRWAAALRAARHAHPQARLRVHHVPPRAHVYAWLFAAGADLIGSRELAATRALLAARDAP
jgi:hypothetical protein